jgi:hypothetical protein
VEIVGAFSVAEALRTSDQDGHTDENQAAKDTDAAVNQRRGNQDDGSNRFEATLAQRWRTTNFTTWFAPACSDCRSQNYEG